MAPHLREGSFTAHSWAFSLLLHAAGVMSAGSLFAHLQPVPQQEPMRLYVSFGEPSAGTPSGSSALSQQSASALQPQSPAPHSQAEPHQTAEPVAEQPISRPPQVADEAASDDRPVVTVQHVIKSAQPMQSTKEIQPIKKPVPVSTTTRIVTVQPVIRAVAQPVPPFPSTPAATPAPNDQLFRMKPDVAAGTQGMQMATNVGPSGRGIATGSGHGWLVDALRQRVEQSKRYPRLARQQGWQGRVVIKAVIREDGSLSEARVTESSGYEVLDLDAVELVKEVCPLNLRQALGQSHVVVHLPIHYRIEQ